MANKETVTVAFVGETTFSDWHPIKASIDTAPQNLFFRVERGNIEGKTSMQYRAELKDGEDGDTIYSDIKASHVAACNDAIKKAGFLAGPLAFETSLRVLFPAPENTGKGHNQPPAYTLSEDEEKEADRFIAEVRHGMDDAEAAEIKTRDANLDVANAVRAMRETFADKKAWAAVRKDKIHALPDGDKVRKLLDNNNLVGVHVAFSKFAEHRELWGAMPERMTTARTFEAEIGKMRSAFAKAVELIISKNEKIKVDGKAVWPYGESLKKMSVSDAVLSVVADHAEVIAGLELHADPVKNTGLKAALSAMVERHLSAWEAGEVDILVEGKEEGQVVVSLPKLDGNFVYTTQYGTEGGDELLNALANALNNNAKARTVEEQTSAITSTAAAIAKETREGKPFAQLPADVAGRHLLNILSAKLDEKQVEASAEDALAVVDFMTERLEVFKAGQITLAELLAAPVEGEPEDAGDAEDAADAA